MLISIVLILLFPIQKIQLALKLTVKCGTAILTVTVLFSDIKRDQHLTMRGWQIKRFWVHELRSDLAQCVKAVQEMIE